MRKTVIRLFSLAMVLAMVLSAVAAADTYYNDPGTLPIVKEPTTLKVGMPVSQHINDYYTNYQTLKMQEDTGFTFEFDVYPSDEYLTKVELMIAAGGADLPDVLTGRSFSQQVIMSWADAGMIIPMTEYYDKLYYWGDTSLDLDPTLDIDYIKRYITSYDGEIYGEFSFNSTKNNQYSGSRLNIYRPWLKALDMEIPSSTDELYAYLIAVRDNDMNGNGDPTDEIPLSGYSDAVSNLRKFLMTPFVYTQNEYWTADDGVIGVCFNTEGWREGLKWVSKLYAENLIDPAYFTQDQNSLTAVCSQDPQVLGSYVRISTSNMAASDPDRYNYDRIEQLANSADPDAPVMTSVVPSLPSITALITCNCEVPEAAYMWLDYMSGYDMSVLTRYGVEGQEWDWIDVEATQAALKEFWENYEGGNWLVEFYGEDALPVVGTRFFSATSWGTMQDTWWGQMGPNVMTEELQQTFGQKIPETDIEKASYVNEYSARHQLEEAISLRDDSRIVAGLVYNEEEQEVITEYYTDIKNYVEEMWAAFVVGTQDINDDAVWEGYLNQLQRLNLDACIEATQSCYTRMNG